MAFPARKNYGQLSESERLAYVAKIQIEAEAVYQRYRMRYAPQDLARMGRYLEGVGGSPVRQLLRQVEAGVFDAMDWGKKLMFLPHVEAQRLRRLHEQFLDRWWQGAILAEPMPDGFKREASTWLDLYAKHHAPLSPYGEVPEEPMFLVTAYGHPDHPAPTQVFELPPILAFGEIPPAGPMMFEEAVEAWERPAVVTVYGNVAMKLSEEDGQALCSVFRGNGLKVWRLRAAPAVPTSPIQAQASTPAPPQPPVHPLAEPIGANSSSEFRTIRPARR
jgi:hypothetical protein